MGKRGGVGELPRESPPRKSGAWLRRSSWSGVSGPETDGSGSFSLQLLNDDGAFASFSSAAAIASCGVNVRAGGGGGDGGDGGGGSSWERVGDGTRRTMRGNRTESTHSRRSSKAPSATAASSSRQSDLITSPQFEW